MEDRNIDHHGTSISVGENETSGKDLVEVLPRQKELVARDEREELRARKKYYKNIEEENERQHIRQQKLNRCKFIGQKLVPIVIFCFSFVYWYYGLTSMMS